MLGHFGKVLIDHLHLLFVARGSELAGDQRFVQLSLSTGLNATSIVVGTLTTASREPLLQHGIIDYANFRNLIYLETHGNAGVRKAVHKVHGTIDGVDYPGWRIGQLIDSGTGAALLLANESALRNVSGIGIYIRSESADL